MKETREKENKELEEILNLALHGKKVKCHGCREEAEIVIKAGYRPSTSVGASKLPDVLPILSDGEIRRVMAEAIKQGQLYGDDGKPLPERAVAQAQRDLIEEVTK